MTEIADAVFPTDTLKVSTDQAELLHLCASDAHGTEVVIALDVSGAVALAVELAAFLRQFPETNPDQGSVRA